MNLSTLLLLTALAPASESADGGLYRADREASDDSAKIVSGMPTEGRWPDAAYLKMFNGDEAAGACTGTLIAPDVVLTAGHCVLKQNGGYFTRIEVKAGVGDLDEPGEVANSTRMVSYPGFNMNDGGTDVALVWLDRNLSIPPRPLASKACAQDALRDGTALILAGFGRPSNLSLSGSKVQRHTMVEIWDADCSNTDRFPTCGPPSWNGEFGMVVGPGVGDACQGDSGGPAYLTIGDASYLVGVTSRATGSGWFPICGEGSVYERTDAVLDWITAEMGTAPTIIDCDGKRARTYEACEFDWDEDGIADCYDICPADPRNDCWDPRNGDPDCGGCNSGRAALAWGILPALVAFGVRRRNQPGGR